MTFNQETIDLGNHRKTNLYWVELDRSRFKFKLSTRMRLSPLRDFDVPKKNMVAGINFGSYFLSDDLVAPLVPFYNLSIKEGRVNQFPTNNRPVIWTKNGEIEFLSLRATGRLKIAESIFTWSGSEIKNGSDITVFGMFDINIVKVGGDSQTPQRKVEYESQFVYCKRGEILFGVKIVNDESVIDVISEGPLDLTQFAYIFRGSNKKLGGCKLGQKIGLITIDKKNILSRDDACSASFSLGKTNKELIKNLRLQLIYPKEGQPKPMSENYLKSWCVVLETSKNIIFFINDARPQTKNQEGINVFELQDVLKAKFDYLWACVGDSGQSSKLMVKKGDIREIYGNMHYKNLKSQSPVWDGVSGRQIPVALLAYE